MMEKLKVRIYFLRHSLISKWILVTCLIILPVNVFSILTVYTVGTTYLEKTTERLRGDLNSFAQEEDSWNRTLQSNMAASHDSFGPF